MTTVCDPAWQLQPMTTQASGTLQHPLYTLPAWRVRGLRQSPSVRVLFCSCVVLPCTRDRVWRGVLLPVAAWRGEQWGGSTPNQTLAGFLIGRGPMAYIGVGRAWLRFCARVCGRASSA
jgi:hypothetical protein